jgi:hypothetical protein
MHVHLQQLNLHVPEVLLQLRVLFMSLSYINLQIVVNFVNACPTEESKPTGNLTVGECLRLAKAMTDHTQLPASCKDYIDKHLAVQKAYEGAGGNMVRHSSCIHTHAVH